MCSIRFDQGIGTVDRKTCLPSTVDSGAGAPPRRANPHHRLPDHHLLWRAGAGDRSGAAGPRIDQAGFVGAGGASSRAAGSRRRGASGPRRVDRAPPGLLPGLIPSWGIAAGRHVIVSDADRRILARIPLDAGFGDPRRILAVISAAQPLVTLGQQVEVADITLPGSGAGALATQRIIKSLPGVVVVVQENT